MLKYIYERSPSPIIITQNHHQSIQLPPKPTLDILSPEINFHVLLTLRVWVNRAHQPLRPLQRALITLLRLSTDETDQIARNVGALAFNVAEVFLDAAAQGVDAFAHFLVVVIVCEEVTAGLPRGGGPGGDGCWVAFVGGQLGFQGFEEVLQGLLAVFASYG